MQREAPRVRAFGAVLLVLLSLTAALAPVEAQENAWGRASNEVSTPPMRMRMGFIGLGRMCTRSYSLERT
jgi:hypothetical protein